MKITQDGEVEQMQTVLQIELEDEDLDPYLDRGYRRVVQRTLIPGFRKGKAPRAIVERFLGRESLLSEVVDYMVADVALKAIEIQKLDAAGNPKLELLEMEPVTVKATVGLKPNVDLGDYKQIRTPTEPFEVTEDDVGEHLDRVRASVTPWEPADRPVETGDLVTMNLTVSADDENRVVLDRSALVHLVGEDDQLKLPGLSDRLVGTGPDEPKTFTLKLPEDFPDEAAADKEAQVNVTVSEIKTRNLPAFDDEFAKSVGTGYDSLEALRTQVEEELTTEAERVQKEKLAEAAVAALVEGATMELAPVLVDHEIDHLLSARESFLTRANIRMDDYMRASGQTLDQLREELRDQAVDRIKRSFAMETFTDSEGLEVTDDEIDERIKALLLQPQPGSRKADLKSEEARESVRQGILSEKGLDRLVAIAKGELADGDDSKQVTSGDDEAPGEGGGDG